MKTKLYILILPILTISVSSCKSTSYSMNSANNKQYRYRDCSTYTNTKYYKKANKKINVKYCNYIY